jgi:hypothetical protein
MLNLFGMVAILAFQSTTKNKFVEGTIQLSFMYSFSSFVWLNPKYPSKFNCIYRLKTFDSGVMVLQLQSHDEEQIIKDTTKTVMKCISQY